MSGRVSRLYSSVSPRMASGGSGARPAKIDMPRMVARCRRGATVRWTPPSAYTPWVTDHDETLVGVPTLDRQERPVRLDVRGRPIVPSRVPEPKPTPLQGVFIYLSIGVLFSGVIAIMALELGTPMSSLWVKVPVLVGGTPAAGRHRGRHRAHLALGPGLAAGAPRHGPVPDGLGGGPRRARSWSSRRSCSSC